MMSASAQAGRRASGLRVLLVEDENLVALLLEDMLAELGHTVVGPVARLDKALETAQREAFDVAIRVLAEHGHLTQIVLLHWARLRKDWAV
jgi:CheY-like chemotaxis protein